MKKRVLSVLVVMVVLAATIAAKTTKVEPKKPAKYEYKAQYFVIGAEYSPKAEFIASMHSATPAIQEMRNSLAERAAEFTADTNLPVDGMRVEEYIFMDADMSIKSHVQAYRVRTGNVVLGFIVTIPIGSDLYVSEYFFEDYSEEEYMMSEFDKVGDREAKFVYEYTKKYN